jgi:four helix bundle protein
MPAIRSYRSFASIKLRWTRRCVSSKLTKTFPVEERFSMVDQMRKASRSVCANIGEAWRKRRYEAHFRSKLSDSEGEAEETRVWIELRLSHCRRSTRVGP